MDLGAPGISVFSTVPFNDYGIKSGTCMATASVTGAIVLYAATHPGATAQQIEAALLNSAVATPTPSLQGKTVTGGRLNISRLLALPPPPQRGALEELSSPERPMTRAMPRAMPRTAERPAGRRGDP